MKKIKKCLLVVGIAIASGYGVCQSIKNDTAELSNLTLANIEALADGESGGGPDMITENMLFIEE